MKLQKIDINMKLQEKNSFDSVIKVSKHCETTFSSLDTEMGSFSYVPSIVGQFFNIAFVLYMLVDERVHIPAPPRRTIQRGSRGL